MPAEIVTTRAASELFADAQLLAVLSEMPRTSAISS